MNDIDIGWTLLCAWAEPQGLDPHDASTKQAYRDWVATCCTCSSGVLGFPVGGSVDGD